MFLLVDICLLVMHIIRTFMLIAVAVQFVMGTSPPLSVSPRSRCNSAANLPGLSGEELTLHVHDSQ